MPTSESQDNQLSIVLEHAYRIMLRKLDYQNHARQILENKLGIALGFTGAIIAGVLAYEGQQSALILNPMIVLSNVLLVVAFSLIIFAMWARKYYDPPDFEIFYSETALKKPIDAYINQVVADSAEAYKRNAKTEMHKAKVYQIALGVLLSGVIIFITMAVIMSGGTVSKSNSQGQNEPIKPATPSPTPGTPNINSPGEGVIRPASPSQTPGTVNKFSDDRREGSIQL